MHSWKSLTVFEHAGSTVKVGSDAMNHTLVGRRDWKKDESQVVKLLQ